jgi:hypothetical protein
MNRVFEREKTRIIQKKILTKTGFKIPNENTIVEKWILIANNNSPTFGLLVQKETFIRKEFFNSIHSILDILFKF